MNIFREKPKTQAAQEMNGSFYNLFNTNIILGQN